MACIAKWKRPIVKELSLLVGIPEAKASKAVNAVFESMGAALQRGEEVKIPGFGILRWRSTPPRRKYLSFYRNIEMLPKLNKVFFKPSKALLRYINQ